MKMNYPVKIPNAPGKLVFREKGNQTYVLYETGRKYDPESQNTQVERKYIGVQIPEQPELMFPNENYLLYFGNEVRDRTEEQDEIILQYETELEQGKTLRAFFDKVYFEFLHMSRRTPENPVSEKKVKRINRILRPLMEMMKGEVYAEFLELIPESGRDEDAERPCSAEQNTCYEKQETSLAEPLTCSDVAIMLTIFKTAVDRHFMKRL